MGDVVSAQEWIDRGLIGGGGGGGGVLTKKKTPIDRTSASHEKTCRRKDVVTKVSSGKKNEASGSSSSKAPSASAIVASLLANGESSKPKVDEADPWERLKSSIDSFIADDSEVEFHFAESLSPKGSIGSSQVLNLRGLFLPYQTNTISLRSNR